MSRNQLVRSSDAGRILLLGAYGAGGGVTGVLCGFVLADLVARAFGDPLQFYHFAIVLAGMGAGIAIGMLIAHTVTRTYAILTPAAISAAATWGSASGLAGCVIAQELIPGSHAANFAAVAWGAMGGFLGWTAAMVLDRYRVVAAMGGGTTAGVAVGWLLFDPAAQLGDILAQAGALGFFIPTTITFAESFSSERNFFIGTPRATRQ